jgi:replicative superfamily II helicase
MRGGVIQKADFKVVYVAPMKALAAEVTANFSRRLAPLGARLPARLTVSLPVCQAIRRP